MRIIQLFSKSGPPVNRWTYAVIALLFPDSIMNLANSWNATDRLEFIFDCMIFFSLIFLWPLFTVSRLIDIRRSRLWILPILLPIVAALIAALEGRTIVSRIAFGLALAFQLPLILLPKPKDLLSLKDLMSSPTGFSNHQKP